MGEAMSSTLSACALLLLVVAEGAIRQRRWDSVDCGVSGSDAAVDDIKIGDGTHDGPSGAAPVTYINPAERNEHVYVQAGQDHGIGVRFSCTSDVKYLDDAPHTSPSTNAFSQDGFPDQSRTITISILTPHSSPQQAWKKHAQCFRTSDGSQMYTCSEAAQSPAYTDAQMKLHTETLARNVYRIFQASS